MARNNNQKPLTLETLVSYNREVLFPWMEENFVTKTDFKELKVNFKEFKNETVSNQDSMLKKLDILLTEKTVREYQEKKEKNVGNYN